MDSMAPHMAVRAARMQKTAEIVSTFPSTPIQAKTLLYSTRTAALEHTVVSSAEVCVGDFAYMSGIQAWKGTIPSFVPNPTNSSAITADSPTGPMASPRSFHSPMSPVPATDHMYA